jgi:hypothetical protein
MDATTKYGTPASHSTTNYFVNQNNSTQFKKTKSLSAATITGQNFVFDTEDMAGPDRVLPYGKNTMASQFGARAGDAPSNPSGR